MLRVSKQKNFQMQSLSHYNFYQKMHQITQKTLQLIRFTVSPDVQDQLHMYFPLTNFSLVKQDQKLRIIREISQCPNLKESLEANTQVYLEIIFFHKQERYSHLFSWQIILKIGEVIQTCSLESENNVLFYFQLKN